MTRESLHMWNGDFETEDLIASALDAIAIKAFPRGVIDWAKWEADARMELAANAAALGVVA